MKEASGFVIEFFEAGDFAALAVGLRIADFLGDGNACAVGEFADGVDKGEIFILHEEGEGIPAFATAEAFVVLPTGVDVERGSFFSMEWAVDLEAAACSLQRKV